ncbi:uncharacterized protein LOC135477076 [Liolophura sinensis]|uniref:uncharacterized protein LOC135477076 n=1 Tax=Liolophura sinensis TaxID=3198878 RepID=UPI003158656B
MVIYALTTRLSEGNVTNTILDRTDKTDIVVSNTPDDTAKTTLRLEDIDSPGIYSGMTEDPNNAEKNTAENTPQKNLSSGNFLPTSTDRDDVTWENITNPPITVYTDYQFDLTHTNRFLARDVTKFICGSGQLCNQTDAQEYGHCIVECDPCQCDEMCHFYGDCCPDLLYIDSPHFPSTPFPDVSCSKEYWTVWENLTDVFMVSSCLPDADPITAEKCERLDINDQDQATPVSVLETQITYRNIFCAKCHNVPDAQAWRHHVACKTDNTLNTAKSKADLWRRVLADEECKVESYPPDGVTLRECYHSEVDRCGENPDPVIENLCVSFKNTVDYYGESSFYTTYRNIFCAVCNGERLNKSMSCSRVEPVLVPPPLTVLLDFNPKPEQPLTTWKEIIMCEKGQAFDPFTDTCRNITCAEGRSLKDGICKELVECEDFIGYLLDVTLYPPSRIFDTTSLRKQYVTKIEDQLTDFHPILIAFMKMSFFTKKKETIDLTKEADLVTASVNIFTHCQTNATQLENVLFTFMWENFFYNSSGELVTLSSRPYFCPQPFKDPAGMTPVNREAHAAFSFDIFPNCQHYKCVHEMTYQTLSLSCPFVEYTDRFEENFTFDPLTYNLEFGNYSFRLNRNEFRFCGRILRICVDTIANMTQVIFGDRTQGIMQGQDLALSIVSLVCISLSLAGLLFTFIVYCAVPKLRTLPGKNSMALIFHLFCSHLIFLTTSNRTTNVVLCQVFGVLVHFFWMASFTWMLICAYHMYRVFTSIRAYVSDGNRDMKKLIMYSLFGIFIPIFIIASCIVTHAVQSKGVDIGYGGAICFLNSPFSIGVFFVGPLAFILVLNAIFFTKTILAIRSVPEMKEASNKSKKQHVFVYIKLSLLFGFTWTFGILATLLESIVLQYVFTVLTGSQGVMIFLSYCANKRTWAELKAEMSGDKKSRFDVISNKKYTMSTGTRDTHSKN